MVEEKAAALSLSKIAYWPNFSASSSEGVDRSLTSSAADPLYDADTHFSHPHIELDMTLTLVDFGFRAATKRSAREALASAYALHDDALRETILEGAQAYYALLKAASTEESDRELEASATRLRDAVSGRYRGGVALLTEELQAETSLSDLVLKRIAAQGDRKTARAALAVLIGIDADGDYVIAPDNNEYTHIQDLQGIHDLLADALREDSKVRSAEADLRTAQADLDLERARNLPTLSLGVTSMYAAQHYYGSNEFSIYENNANNAQRTNEVSLQVQIPLTDLASRHYSIKSAQANVEVKWNDLETARRQVAVAVWDAYQKLDVSNQSLGVAQQMLETARQLYEVTEGRYFAGAGSLIDVLNAQRDLETARSRQVNAIFDLQLARLTLLASIGQLNLPGVQP